MKKRVKETSTEQASQVSVMKASHDANQAAMRKLTAIVIAPTEKATGEGGTGKSEGLPEDPFYGIAREGKVVQPPFDLLVLAMLREHSAELGQCISALEINIDSTGHRFVSRLRMDDATKFSPTKEGQPDQASGENDDDDDDDDAKEKVQKKPGEITPTGEKPDPERDALLEAARLERIALINFFEYATDESFQMFRRKLRIDLESTGNAWFEIIRNSSGRIIGFTHLPSYQMRLGKLDVDPFLVDRPILELQADGSVRAKTIKQYRRFRRHVQSRAIRLRTMDVVDGHKTRWFKDFGDPRRLHKETGKFEDEMNEEKVPDNMLANEVIHLRIYSPRTPYGLPRYIGQLLTIYGDRSAEEINFTTLRNNNIPSMMLMVSDGHLTNDTIERIKSFMESNVQSSQNRSKILICQAESAEGEPGEQGGQVKLDLKPLTREQISDAMFQDYSKNNRDTIRRAFRIPPIFVGSTQDYTRATAESSRRLADEQIFEPERTEFDRLINRIIFPAMGITYHRFQSNTPNTTDNAQLVRILAGAEKTGGMTPAIARVMIENILGLDLPPFPKDFPQHMPFSLTMAEAVKNKADPTEPGQQVTALKQLEALGIIGGDGEINFDLEDFEDGNIAKGAEKLLALNRTAEMLWRAQGSKMASE